jgi:hypothetical protein
MVRSSFLLLASGFLLSMSLFVGCQSQSSSSSAAPAAAAAPVGPTIRIKAGSDTPFTDSAGNVWQADTGFDGGDTSPRDADMQIANTKDPGLFRSEHYSMDSFSYNLPNGKYVVKLYFCETYDGISGPGDRVFSFNVQGQDVTDFDVWAKTGGAQRADIETYNVNITDGQLKITFTPKADNPEINAIEIIPQG